MSLEYTQLTLCESVKEFPVGLDQISRTLKQKGCSHTFPHSVMGGKGIPLIIMFLRGCCQTECWVLS